MAAVQRLTRSNAQNNDRKFYIHKINIGFRVLSPFKTPPDRNTAVHRKLKKKRRKQTKPVPFGVGILQRAWAFTLDSQGERQNRFIKLYCGLALISFQHALWEESSGLKIELNAVNVAIILLLRQPLAREKMP